MLAQVETENMSQAKEIYGLINKNDLNHLAAHYADNSVLVNMSWNVTYRGRSGILDYVRNFKSAFPDLKLNVSHMVAEEDFVVSEYIVRGTHRGTLISPAGNIAPTNKTIEVPMCEILQFKDGKLVTSRQYWDTGTFARQLGLVSDSKPVID